MDRLGCIKMKIFCMSELNHHMKRPKIMAWKIN